MQEIAQFKGMLLMCKRKGIQYYLAQLDFHQYKVNLYVKYVVPNIFRSNHNVVTEKWWFLEGCMNYTYVVFCCKYVTFE